MLESIFNKVAGLKAIYFQEHLRTNTRVWPPKICLLLVLGTPMLEDR